MAIQTSIAAAPAIGFPGMLADSGYHDILSGMAASRKRVSVVIVAANAGVYTITINGTPFEYTADGSATTAEIAVGLRNLINAGSEPVIASGTDTPLIIESTIDGTAGDFTYADSASAGSLTETVLVAQSQALRVGKVVVLDENQDAGPVDYVVRLPRLAADITGGRALGIVVEEFAIEQLPVSAAAYVDTLTLGGNSMFNVLHEGRCYVQCENAFVKGGAVYARFASGAGGSVLGSIRATDDDTSTAAIYPRAKFLNSGSAGGLAIVELVR